MAFLFGLSGSTSLADIADTVAAANEDTRAALILAVVMLTAGLGFKMAIVPFQMWVPDVYEGAPTPITAFLSVGSKAAGFAVLLRIFFEALGDRFISDDWANVFAALAAVSMTLGNVVALTQNNIKRMLGYSSIAQAGYFLLGVAAISANGGDLALGASGVVFFLASYAFTNLGAFVAIIAISNRTGSDEITSYAGMARRSPLLALGLTLCLISLTGIPPTAGFIAKIYIFDAAVQSDLVWLVIIGVLNSVVSAYYYLRVVLQMYAEEPTSEEQVPAGPALGLALAIAIGGVLFIGILPSFLLEASESAAKVFS
jgi:NADH-quinone oxidoreductase subunit N